MADMQVSVGLGLDLSEYEQGLARAEAALRQLNDSMVSSVGMMQRLTGEVAAAWSGINGSIRQAVEQAGMLSHVAVSQQSSSGASAASGTLTRALAQAVSGLSVQLNGEKVGSLVAPAVNKQLAALATARRYTL